MHYEPELQAALDAAGKAGAVILGHYAAFEKIDDPRIDVSTIADRESQEVILQSLRAAFPGDAFCAEEQTPSLAGAATTGPRQWIIDPIDGTRGFVKKNGEFSVMIGLVEGGRLAVGVVAQSAVGKLTYAVRGGGCWRIDAGGAGPVRCRVGTTGDLPSSTLTQSHGKGPGPSAPVRKLAPARVIETYSAGVKLALVARGEADLYVNTYAEFHDWDIAAGHLLVEEAGGTVTGLRGEPLVYGTPGAWQRQGLLATNGLLHNAAVRRLAADS